MNTRNQRVQRWGTREEGVWGKQGGGEGKGRRGNEEKQGSRQGEARLLFLSVH